MSLPLLPLPLALPGPAPALLLALALLLLLYLLHPFLALLLHDARSPLRLLPGPRAPSFLLGNLAAIADQENTDVIAQWVAHHGSTFVYRGFVGGRRLLTTDPAALAWILGRAYEFPKPEFVRESLAAMAAGQDGLLTVEGDVHRRQNQAFTAPHVRTLVPIFWSKASQDGEKPKQETVETRPTVDVLSWLGRATLDVIGEAGFGYRFASLASATKRLVDADNHAVTTADGDSDGDSELAAAFGVIFSTARRFRVMTVLQVWFPLLRRFVSRGRLCHPLASSLCPGAANAHAGVDGGVGRKTADRIEGDRTMLGRDILSVLIRSNMASTPAQQLSLSEVLSQISTFLAAGHETTASALTWTLYALARAPDEQHRLRSALRALGPSSAPPRASSRTQAPLPDPAATSESESDPDPALLAAIERLPALDRAVKEALRLHAPVGSTMRTYVGAARETVVPVARGGLEEEWTIERGVRLHRGDIITIPIQAVNRSKEVWGEDAKEFRPDRWIALPKAASELQGLYAHTLTFLDGHRACIGYKFALSECVFAPCPLPRCVGLRLIIIILFWGGGFGLWQNQGVSVCAAARPRVLDGRGRRDRETRQRCHAPVRPIRAGLGEPDAAAHPARARGRGLGRIVPSINYLI
ncbi:cytochrome P450 monooxygenase 83 [Heterobasidion irregulare TC 32-1]|uniref:Cytochrome P450 monooxygenase 83 n=1 Tax=Heterobasidion irregulare (strain TC 32-1) TaxID=747525 RepID=W4K824_HETIT|nr:cytochrome P450 monooxygenase 83 [Heterobasidion irregulare TC 32-1]ETW81977.1 cytochrome P450 monooxygenase 83 [Heterobasidion irregulare TC 32-1]